MKVDLPSGQPVTLDHSDIVRLAHAARDGDVRAVEALIEHLSESVARQAARHVPRDVVVDIVAETMFALTQNIGSVRDLSVITHWVRCVTVRMCHDYWRRVYRERQALEEYRSEIKREGVVPETEADLEAALAQLAPTERLLVTLHYFEDRPMKEAAELIGISVTNAKVRLFRIRKRLRALLENDSEIGSLESSGEAV